jgi:protease IV
MKLFKLLVLLVFASSVAFSQVNDFQIPIANSDNVFSLFSNPAGLGTNRGFQMLYANGYDDNEFKNINTFVLNAGHFGFAYQQDYEDGTNFSRYSLGTGWQLNRMLKMGFSYSWNSSGNLSDGLSMGLLFRPLKSISFGFNGNFLNEPTAKKPDYQAGISFRPFDNRTTISADAFFSKENNSDYFKNIDWRVNVEAEPLDGILLRGTYSENYFGIGLGLAFKFGLLGSYNSFNSSDKLEKGSLYIQSSSEYFHSMIDSFRPKYVQFVLKGSIIEQNRGWGIFSSKKLTVYQFGKIIKKLQEDENVSGIVLEIDSFGAGYAKIQEMTKFLHEFKKSGKELIVYAEFLNTRQYLLAAEADKIFLHPAGHLNLTGLQFTSMFIKGTLDKLGIVAELEHIKEYKTASDMFTRDSMSQYQREVINSFADQFYEDILDEISQKRRIEKNKLKGIIDNAPYLADEAKELGLIDEYFYRDELKSYFDENKNLNNLISYSTYSLLRPYEYDWEIEPNEKIAIVFATGTIMTGNNGNEFYVGETMGDNTIANAIKSARENSDIKAIVLRIDSGGGVAFASEVIWREVALTTKGENKKPVIVSMSDVAASGGYFIACPADEIFANPATTTGSIGIYSGKINLKGLFEKLGIKFQHIKRGENAGMNSYTRGYTDKERARMIHTMEDGYDRFISRVAEGRDMTKEEVNEIGRGRIWTGRQAVGKGIVDSLGGLFDAIKAAEQKSGILQGDEYGILMLPDYGFVWPFGGNDFVMESMISDQLPVEIKQLIQYGYKFQIFENEPYLYLMPYDLIID